MEISRGALERYRDDSIRYPGFAERSRRDRRQISAFFWTESGDESGAGSGRRVAEGESKRTEEKETRREMEYR
jgi:hypothetical protein